MKYWLCYCGGMVLWAVLCASGVHWLGWRGDQAVFLCALLGVFYGCVVLTLTRRWYRRPQPRRIEPHQVATDDPIAAAIIAECWNTGRTQCWVLDDAGNIVRREDPPA